MTRKRTDVHAPRNLVTEDYDFVGCGMYGSGDEPGYSPLTEGYGRTLIDEGWAFAENHAAGDCYHCGARLKYYAVLKHNPTRTLIRVGETCLDNRFERSTAEFQRLRKQAALDRQRQRVKHRRNRFFAEYPDAEEAYGWCTWCIEDPDGYGYGWEGTRHKFVAKLNREGEVSQRFLKMIMRDMARTERFEEEKAARAAAEAENSAPVIEGRIAITGEVLTTKWQDSDYGGALKMLVRDDRGFKVWGTVPKALEGEARYDYFDADGARQTVPEKPGAGRGDRITFTATVERSRDDETFGFFKRPSKASIIERAADEED